MQRLPSRTYSYLRLPYKTDIVEFSAEGLVVALELRYDFQQGLVRITTVLIKNFAVERSGLSVLAQFKALVENLVAPHDVELGL